MWAKQALNLGPVEKQRNEPPDRPALPSLDFLIVQIFAKLCPIQNYNNKNHGNITAMDAF